MSESESEIERASEKEEEVEEVEEKERDQPLTDGDKETFELAFWASIRDKFLNKKTSKVIKTEEKLKIISKQKTEVKPQPGEKFKIKKKTTS